MHLAWNATPTFTRSTDTTLQLACEGPFQRTLTGYNVTRYSVAFKSAKPSVVTERYDRYLIIYSWVVYLYASRASRDENRLQVLQLLHVW